MAATALPEHMQDRKNQDRTSALFFAVGSILSLATLTMPSWEGRETRYLGILWGLALVDALFVWEKAGRLPAWFHHVNIILLTLVISGGILLNGEAGPVFTPFYLAGAIYAFFFFNRVAALAHMGWIAACYGVALQIGGTELGIAYAGWLMLVGMLVVTGGAIAWLVEQIRSMAALEHDLKEEADQARAEADRANQAKSEFLSRMSHELRTPMNAVLGFAQVLEMDELTEDQSRSVDQITKAGNHLLELINEVLDLARIEAGRLSLSMEPVQWAGALEECLTLIKPLAAERGIDMGSHIDGIEDTFVRADRQRLKQALLNILSNAVKYNSENGSIIVTAVQTEGMIRISVTDTGPGVPEDRLDDLFVAFNRLDADGTEVEGTGLGLALTKRLVEAMGGRVRVLSKVGRGSTFSIELEACEGQLERQIDLTVETPSPSTNGHTLSVLCIEDNPANMKLVERLFATRPNVELMSSMQGQLGIELAQEHHPDLILLDMNLPDIDGDKVLAVLHEDPRTARIPVVMISADATPGQAKRLMDAGAFDYLTKPIDVTRFFQVIDEALEVEAR